MAMVVGAEHRALAAAEAEEEPALIGRWRKPCSADQKDPPSSLSASRTLLAQELLRSCVLKNTFVEPPPEYQKKAGLQRSTSEPTLSTRKEEARSAAEAAKAPEAASAAGTAEEEASTADTGVGSEASEEEVETSSSSSNAEGTSSGALAQVEALEEYGGEGSSCVGLMRALAAAAAVYKELDAMDAEERKACQAVSLSQADALLESLRGDPSPPAPPPAAAPPARLRARAEPWRPLDAFGTQTRRITASVLVHIRSLPMTHDAFMEDDWRGWRIEVHVRREDLLQVECLLSNAKAALMRAAQSEANAHLLGSCADPFVAQSMGFSAKVGYMRNQAMACWDAFASGHCHRWTCRWEHPARWNVIEVSVSAVPGSS